MVARLVAVLLTYPEVSQIIVTLNIPEVMRLTVDSRLEVVENQTPKGFGANHNAAFRACRQDYFCSLNPDVELPENPFPRLISVLRASNASLIAPLIKSLGGEVEDSVRHFPLPWSLIGRVCGRPDGRYSISTDSPHFCPEWVAGMFMLFDSSAFRALEGFDEAYFLYYEDVDICVRCWKLGMRVVACPSVTVIHDARRDSHRKIRYLRYHLESMVRYFWMYWGRLPDVEKLVNR